MSNFDKSINVKLTSRILIGWMIILSLILVSNLLRENDDVMFFNVGPNPQFIFMGIKIDTLGKYALLILSMSMNTCIRNLNQDILNPWLIHNIQNEDKLKHSNSTAYEITIVNGIYTWFDYIFCLNLVMIQIDMILIEIFVDMIVNVIITKMYLYFKKNDLNIIINRKNYNSIDMIV